MHQGYTSYQREGAGGLETHMGGVCCCIFTFPPSVLGPAARSW